MSSCWKDLPAGDSIVKINDGLFHVRLIFKGQRTLLINFINPDNMNETKALWIYGIEYMRLIESLPKSFNRDGKLEEILKTE